MNPRVAKLLLGLLLPQPLRWFFGQQASRLNAHLGQALAGEHRRRLLHMPESMRGNALALTAEDGFHPGSEGCRLWAQALAAEIAELPPTGVDRTEQAALSG